MLDIYDIILLGGVFCSFVTSIILFTQSRYQLHANRLLSIVIFGLGWYGFLYLLIQTGWLNAVPGIYRIGSPLYYLGPPCAYLYLRSVIMNETRFRKWDWLHFLPAILHVIDLLPFYFADVETKRQIVMEITRHFNSSYQKASGLVPAIWHFILRPLQGLIYLFFIWSLLVRSVSRKNYYSISAGIFNRIKKWLFGFTFFITIIYIGFSVQTIIGVMNTDSAVSVASASRPTHITLAIVFFVLSIYLFFKPEILYGTLMITPAEAAGTSQPASLPVASAGAVDLPAKPPVQEDAFDPKDTLLNEETTLLYAKKIREHLLVHRSFLKQGLTITELAVELSMPMHHLSYVLNHHYKQRFTDFINGCRIVHVKQLLEEGGSQAFKLESLAREAGFSGRSTFFTAFKKLAGLTPNEYLRQINADSPAPGDKS